MDEIILMRKLKRKDEWALGKIIDLYSSYITCIVWELLHKKGTKEDIEEVVADTFISLWLTAERINYKKYSSVKSYLGMIARNKAKDWLRAYRGEILELNDDILLIDGDVEHLILQKEQQLIIGRTLEKLRETDRKIFIMYYYRYKKIETSVYKGYKQDKIEMRGDRAEMSDFPLYLNTVAGGLDRRDQTIGGFSFVVKIYAVPVVEIIG